MTVVFVCYLTFSNIHYLNSHMIHHYKGNIVRKLMLIRKLRAGKILSRSELFLQIFKSAL
jgi:hypothetical protein